jgi:hypothetical protein
MYPTVEAAIAAATEAARATPWFTHLVIQQLWADTDQPTFRVVVCEDGLDDDLGGPEAA